MSLSNEYRDYLLSKGADVVAFGDISEVDFYARQGFPIGVSIGIALKKNIIKGIEDGPTLEYSKLYDDVNGKLNILARLGEEYLVNKGFKALGKGGEHVRQDSETLRTPLPHKTVATRAGVGWIGKCALLVTPQYGSALRITAVLTDAPLETAVPIDASRCGECVICKNVCPAGAVKGVPWHKELVREDFYDAKLCETKARELCAKIGLNMSLCGQCIVKCPHTRHYLEASSTQKPALLEITSTEEK